MCRSIKVLRTADHVVHDDEVRAAALQYVRKIAGMRHPSKKNEAVFEKAVNDIAHASAHLLADINVVVRVKEKYGTE